MRLEFGALGAKTRTLPQWEARAAVDTIRIIVHMQRDFQRRVTHRGEVAIGRSEMNKNEGVDGKKNELLWWTFAMLLTTQITVCPCISTMTNAEFRGEK
jgi:hypothetical protein